MDKTWPSLRTIVPSTATARSSRPPKVNVQANEKPSRVFLRLKRKRSDNPMECLMVQSEPTIKRPKVDLLEAFTKLSTDEKCFVFKHIDTMEEQIEPGRGRWTERLKRKARSLKDERADILAKKQLVSVFQKDPTASKQTEKRMEEQQSRSKSRRNEEMFKSRGLQPIVEIKEKQTMEVHGIRLVDLQLSTIADTDTSLTTCTDAHLEISEADVVMMNGARLKSTRVLNPQERMLDEAIWTAFRLNDFTPFFHIYHTQRLQFRADPITFQRPADGRTILMAAALHGRSDVIEVLLRSDSTSVLSQDWEGATAAVFAKRGGHSNVETALLACEEAGREKDYVYDIYCVDISASEQQETMHDKTTDSRDGFEQTSINSVPVVSVSSEVQRWLSEDTPSDEVEEYMLESDIDSNDEADGLSEDSNDEDNVANDYPDEESSDESVGSSEDLDEIGARRRWQNSEEFTERDEVEY
ncbi:unnamed protein product [Peronospora belbahrii]|uniref:Probable RNA polymerase II nuclear localization protein SLC7A6OS n=1 Tax=Peronospora belbahrii TaxID=622444 RepID=A0ABN8D717_9STRA|nr:unnamed protein product [Peronospora belbahrii]